MNEMSDITFTQITAAMCSKPLNRASNRVRPWSQIVAEHNAKPKTLVLKVRGKVVSSVTGYSKGQVNV